MLVFPFYRNGNQYPTAEELKDAIVECWINLNNVFRSLVAIYAVPLCSNNSVKGKQNPFLNYNKDPFPKILYLGNPPKKLSARLFHNSFLRHKEALCYSAIGSEWSAKSNYSIIK